MFKIALPLVNAIGNDLYFCIVEQWNQDAIYQYFPKEEDNMF